MGKASPIPAAQVQTTPSKAAPEAPKLEGEISNEETGPSGEQIALRALEIVKQRRAEVAPETRPGFAERTAKQAAITAPLNYGAELFGIEKPPEAKTWGETGADVLGTGIGMVPETVAATSLAGGGLAALGAKALLPKVAFQAAADFLSGLAIGNLEKGGGMGTGLLYGGVQAGAPLIGQAYKALKGNVPPAVVMQAAKEGNLSPAVAERAATEAFGDDVEKLRAQAMWMGGKAQPIRLSNLPDELAEEMVPATPAIPEPPKPAMELLPMLDEEASFAYGPPTPELAAEKLQTEIAEPLAKVADEISAPLEKFEVQSADFGTAKAFEEALVSSSLDDPTIETSRKIRSGLEQITGRIGKAIEKVPGPITSEGELNIEIFPRLAQVLGNQNFKAIGKLFGEEKPLNSLMNAGLSYDEAKAALETLEKAGKSMEAVPVSVVGEAAAKGPKGIKVPSELEAMRVKKAKVPLEKVEKIPGEEAIGKSFSFEDASSLLDQTGIGFDRALEAGFFSAGKGSNLELTKVGYAYLRNNFPEALLGKSELPKALEGTGIDFKHLASIRGGEKSPIIFNSAEMENGFQFFARHDVDYMMKKKWVEKVGDDQFKYTNLGRWIQTNKGVLKSYEAAAGLRSEGAQELLAQQRRLYDDIIQTALDTAKIDPDC